ncbi:hypothetical protein FACS1894201_02430 [Bacteroidia bacterium]|nr:hypothetical protein FACS1894201_02430 [Bacteroidia bacterium]
MNVCLYAQEKYQPFIDEIIKVHGQKQYSFEKMSDKAVKLYLEENQRNEDVSKYKYLFIPEIVLKKIEKTLSTDRYNKFSAVF